MNPTQDAKLTKLCDGLALAHSNNFGPFSNRSLSSFPPIAVIQWSQKIWKMKRGFSQEKPNVEESIAHLESADVSCADHPAQCIHLAAPLCGRFTTCWQNNSSEAHRSPIEKTTTSQIWKKSESQAAPRMSVESVQCSSKEPAMDQIASEDGTVWRSGLPASSLAPAMSLSVFCVFFKFVLNLLFDNIFG